MRSDPPLTCGSCGGELAQEGPAPVFSTCRYCGASTKHRDVPTSRPVFSPDDPAALYIPVGREGTIRWSRVRVTGYVIFSHERSEATRYFIEYMLEAGPRAERRRLLEQDGEWFLVRPLRAHEVQIKDSPGSGYPSTAVYRDKAFEKTYRLENSLERSKGVSDACIGGRLSLVAERYTSSEGTVRVENRAGPKCYYAFCEPLSPEEVADGFGLDELPPRGPQGRAKANPVGVIKRLDGCLEAIGPIFIAVVIGIPLLVLLFVDGCRC